MPTNKKRTRLAMRKGGSTRIPAYLRPAKEFKSGYDEFYTGFQTRVPKAKGKRKRKKR